MFLVKYIIIRNTSTVILFRVKCLCIDMYRRDTKKIGQIGEDIACQFLIRKGFRILDRNFSKKHGEVDIVAEKSGIVRFVEVKTVSRENTLDAEYRPEEQVHQKKLDKIARAASVYMDKHCHTDTDYQIDVVGILLNAKNKTAKCRLFEGVT